MPPYAGARELLLRGEVAEVPDSVDTRTRGSGRSGLGVHFLHWVAIVLGLASLRCLVPHRLPKAATGSPY
jgi:hypothetical protein